MFLPLAAGCGAPYLVTAPLTAHLPSGSTYTIGPIVMDPPDSSSKKAGPSPEEIANFQMHLSEQLRTVYIDGLSPAPQGPGDYQVTGRIFGYSSGSADGTPVSAGGGGAYVACALELREVATGRIVFGGRFQPGAFDSGSQAFSKTAYRFVEALRKQVNELPRPSRSTGAR